MIESNINIISNIYIRSDPDIKRDKEYVSKISGHQMLRAIQRQYYGFDLIPLSAAQQKIVSESVRCAYAKNGEMSYGPIVKNGLIEWVNRCENPDCARYAICSSGKDFRTIRRESKPEEADEDAESLRDFFELIGVKVEEDVVIFKHDKNPSKTVETELNSKTYVEPTKLSVSEIIEYSNKYVEIADPERIIRAPLDSHIMLNSGPGTGKTYTIIQRLIHILSENLCPAEGIYILCYTRSAKKVIESKIDDAIIRGVVSPSAKNICLLTFDSYATYFLMAMKEQGVIREDLSGYDYNSRIKLFNKYISKEDFREVNYFIVDEIQDLVNERAQMVLNILKCLECGYLLAGDRCQSIYDFEADDDATIDSTKFYEMAEKQFPDDMIRYEISVNRRQNPNLAAEASGMRRVLLNKSFSEQNKYANDVMQRYSGKIKIESYIDRMMSEPSVSTAILCRSNGEAEYISSLLCEKGIRHNLNRGVNNIDPLPRWVADIFWDYCRDTISKGSFIDRFNFRCSLDIDPEEIWKYLCDVTRSQDPFAVNVPKFISALSLSNDVPNDFREKAPLLTVSTIHKAKGSEFDRVILLESNIDPTSENAEEARIRYVALTRPKEQLTVLKKMTKYFKRTTSERVIETGLHNLYKTSKRFCKCITVGLTGDVDNTGFAAGDFNSTLELQEYIIKNIRVYDPLTAERSRLTGLYEIMHNGKRIGTLSANMVNEIDLGVSATDYNYNLPCALDNLYVSAITSEILKKYSENIPIEFRKSKICFGIQVTGLAKLIFEKK